MQNQYESPEETKLRIEHRETPAGRLLTRVGFDYWDTESAARKVAEHAAGEIEELRAAMIPLLTIVDRLHRDTYAPNESSDWKEQADARAILAKTEPAK